MRNHLHYPLLLALSVFSLTAKAQQPGAKIDVQHYSFALNINDTNNVIKGRATLTAKFLKSTNEFGLDLLKKNAAGKGMLVTGIKENNRSLAFSQDSARLIIRATAKAKSLHTYVISYEGIPADGLIISTNKYGHRTFFGDNWATRARYWLPCADNPADKASVEFILTAPAHYKVVANGLKVQEKLLTYNKKLTHWKETARLPTKVMIFGAADFAVDQPGKGGTPVYTYVFPEDSVVGFKSYAVAAKILPWFEKNIGPYAYKKLANVQSKTIFGGMENAGAIFYYEKSVNDKGIESLMAHEIAHQWFGDAISEKTWWHVWLSEGFATYMTNLYIENKYGTDSLRRNLIADRNQVFKFEKKYSAPVVDSTFSGKKEIELLNTNAYQKGGWVLHMLRRKIGDKAFWRGIVSYYKQYNGGNANTDDLRLVMEKAGGVDLKPFFKQWLRTAGHPSLNITHTYNEATKTITIKAEQQQDGLYQMALEYSVDGKLYKMNIKDKVTTVRVPAGSPQPVLTFDPGVNLLASFSEK